MRNFVKRTDWTTVFDDSAGRDLVNLRRKELDDRFTSGLEFGVGPGGLKYRSGAIAGEKLKLLFNGLVREDLGSRDIEQLPLPIAIVATDIGSGERVAMRTGNLSSAMRSSMSCPACSRPCRATAEARRRRPPRQRADRRDPRSLPARRRDRDQRRLAAVQAGGGDGPGERHGPDGEPARRAERRQVDHPPAQAGHLPAPRPGNDHERLVRPPDRGGRPRAQGRSRIAAGAAPLSMEPREYNIWRLGIRQILTPSRP
jgi:hypothetical protein